jgi:putative addiction module killer protein
MEIRHYVDPRGRAPYRVWFAGLPDARARWSIERRMEHFRQGNPGDTKYCRGGVWEMRIHPGPGYRVYFGRDGGRLVLLLGGSNKASQQRDPDRAVMAWQDYVEQTK